MKDKGTSKYRSKKHIGLTRTFCGQAADVCVGQETQFRRKTVISEKYNDEY